MATESIVVGVHRGEGQSERVQLSAERVEWDRDGTCRCYVNETEIATFPNALYAVRSDELEG